MKLKVIKLKNFKRFDDLTINLGKNPRKIIALVGPNGCGKSSVFDAFMERQRDFRATKDRPENYFFSKSWYAADEAVNSKTYNKQEAVYLEKENGDRVFDKRSFYFRSSYRFTSRLDIQNIRSLPELGDDNESPGSSVSTDLRLQQNYERLLGNFFTEVYGKEITGLQWIENNTKNINNILKNVLGIEISFLGNPTKKEAQLYFSKENSKDFPYENLSSGEKEVVDIIVDLLIKKDEFNDTVYCIDEPELHLNTAIQRKLLLEIEKLIPDNCQLWVATHSIGFLRALQEDLKEKASILDFSEKDYFNGAMEIVPIITTRENWQRIFQTALEDLTKLMAPGRIIYCEGKIQNSLDEKIFNIIFGEEFYDTLFLSSGNKDDVQKYSAVALTVLNKAFSDVEIIALIDRDDNLEETKKGRVTIRKLIRKEFENYLFDKEVLKKYCVKNNKEFKEIEYDSLVKDVVNDNIEAIEGDLIKKSCDRDLTPDLKIDLARLLTRDGEIYKNLRNEIFGV
jgi:hypothetical protein